MYCNSLSRLTSNLFSGGPLSWQQKLCLQYSANMPQNIKTFGRWVTGSTDHVFVLCCIVWLNNDNPVSRQQNAQQCLQRVN